MQKSNAKINNFFIGFCNFREFTEKQTLIKSESTPSPLIFTFFVRKSPKNVYVVNIFLFIWIFKKFNLLRKKVVAECRITCAKGLAIRNEKHLRQRASMFRMRHAIIVSRSEPVSSARRLRSARLAKTVRSMFSCVASFAVLKRKLFCEASGFEE